MVDDAIFAEAAFALQPREGLMNYALADCAVVQADIFVKTYSAADPVQ